MNVERGREPIDFYPADLGRASFDDSVASEGRLGSLGECFRRRGALLDF